MATDTVDLTFIGKSLEKLQQEQREVRRGLTDIRQLALAIVDQHNRTDRHIGELKDELGLMVKSEIMGRLANFETRTVDAVVHAIDILEERVRRLEASSQT
jgi:hypothetical protein